jgi:hypothetical protein
MFVITPINVLNESHSCHQPFGTLEVNLVYHISINELVSETIIICRVVKR